MNGSTLNTLMSQIVTKHIRWDRFAEDIGFVFLTKQCVRSILEHVDDKVIRDIATTTCRAAMRDAVIFIKGRESLDNFLEVIDLWFNASHIPFRHITVRGENRYVIQHDFGRKWSLYIVSVINSLSTEMGFKMKNQKINDHSAFFDILVSR